MGKYIEWSVETDAQHKKSRDHNVVWKLNQQKITAAQRLDGCYVITTKIPKAIMGKHEVVASYKRLQMVEQAFRNLKTVQIEMRPLYHHLNRRIKAHVFLCMLGYYVQWHMHQLLKPLFRQDERGRKRRWTFTNVLETLRGITSNKVSVAGTTFYRHSTPTNEQDKILKLLEINWP